MNSSNMPYRIHLTMRHRGKPVHTSVEIRTEDYDNIDQLLRDIEAFIEDNFEYDIQQLEDQTSVSVID